MLIGSSLYIFTFQDTARAHLKETIHRLKQSGKWKLLMLTGDHEYSAGRIAKQLGLDEYVR